MRLGNWIGFPDRKRNVLGKNKDFYDIKEFLQQKNIKCWLINNRIGKYKL